MLLRCEGGVPGWMPRFTLTRASINLLMKILLL
jgi:hypothetical protein